MKILSICSILTLLLNSGCVSNEVKPIGSVEIPIAVSCVKQVPDKPKSCYDSLVYGATMFEKVKCLLLDRDKSRGYEWQLEAVVDACH